MKKKICFVVPGTYYLFNPKENHPKETIGGAQYQTYIIGKELAKKELDIYFSVFYDTNSFEEIISGVNIIKTANFKTNIISKTILLFKHLNKINANLYIFRSADFGAGITILFLKYILKKKVLYMVAADSEIKFGTSINTFGLFSSLVMQMVYKKSDYITVQTQQQKQLFTKFKKREPDYLLKNIMPQANYSLSIENKKKEFTLWVGRLSKIKNAELFLALANRNPEENFVMIAPKARNELKYGNMIAAQAKKIKNIKFIEYVHYSEIHNFFSDAKIFVLSSFLEGFSNTMAEAMIHQCAILSYAVNTDQIISKHQLGFVADANKEIFFEKFNELKSNSLLMEKFGKNGRQYITQNHNINQIVFDFAHFIKKIG